MQNPNKKESGSVRKNAASLEKFSSSTPSLDLTMARRGTRGDSPQSRHDHPARPVLDEAAIGDDHALEDWAHEAGLAWHDELETVGGDERHVLGRRWNGSGCGRSHGASSWGGGDNRDVVVGCCAPRDHLVRTPPGWLGINWKIRRGQVDLTVFFRIQKNQDGDLPRVLLARAALWVSRCVGLLGGGEVGKF